MTDTPSGQAMSAWITVRPEWIDFNGHMNTAYYNILFDEGIIDIYRFIGFGPTYARAERKPQMSQISASATCANCTRGTACAAPLPCLITIPNGSIAFGRCITRMAG